MPGTQLSVNTTTENFQQQQQTQQQVTDDWELTEEDKRLIRADWDLARRDLQAVATKLFLIFFVQNPTYPQMFRWTKGMDMSSLTMDTAVDSLPKRMQRHAIGAAKQVSNIVDNLDNPEELEEVFTMIGQQHAHRGVGPTHWERFNVALLYTLRTLLSSAGYDDRHDVAWRKALHVITEAALKTTKIAEEE